MTVPWPQPAASSNQSSAAQAQTQQQPQSATDPQAQGQPPQLEEWSEAQYVSALAHLETLQSQLDDLRLLLPSIVHSLTTPYPDPQSMFQGVRGAILSGSRKLDVFRKTWDDGRTREVLARARGSWAGNADVSGAEGVPEWGWVERWEEMEKERKDGDGAEGEGNTASKKE